MSDFIRDEGSLVFISCRAGAGSAGAQLLIAISRLLPGRFIKGYVSYGAFSSGIGNTMAGNVTDTLSSVASAPPPGYPRYYEGCPSEKVAKDGHIVRHADIRAMWAQLERVDRARANRIFEDWCTDRTTLIRGPRDAYHELGWARPRHPGSEYVWRARERTVEEYYAVRYLNDR